MTGQHSGHNGHHRHDGSGDCDTTGRHGMLLFGDDPLYLSHLPMYECPHNFQVLVEAVLEPDAHDLLRADRARHGDGLYTFDPVPFPLGELEPHDGVAARTSMEGTLVRGHFERGGTPVATGVRVDAPSVVWFTELDVEPGPARPLEYLCFGRGDRVYLAHKLATRPSFDQVLAVRFVPGTVHTLGGRPLHDDVSEIRVAQAQPVSVGRDGGVEHRLAAGDVVTASFPLTRSPGSSRGFTVGVKVERQIYLEIDELA